MRLLPARPAGLLIVGSALLSACSVSQPCDEGQLFTRGVCFDTPDAGPRAPDAGGPADGGGDGGQCAGAFAGLGDSCALAAECGCKADYCVAFPGYNYCTRAGCLTDASICPAGWSCVDLAAYGQPAICMK